MFALVQGLCRELGYVSLKELEELRGPMGLPVAAPHDCSAPPPAALRIQRSESCKDRFFRFPDLFRIEELWHVSSVTLLLLST